jgi:CMP-N,N'-diacetyllegionaminic acid synthase
VRVLGLVPARGGSQRVKGKNLALLGGKTLVRRALETAVASSAFDPVALSSESEEILAEANDLSEVVLVRRPPELATDTALSYDVVRHALKTLEGDGDRFDAVAVIQCTSPFTAPEDLAATVELLERSGAASAVSVTKVDKAHHPLKLKRLEGDRLVPFLEDDRMQPSHALPELWIRNGSIYVSRREVLESGQLVADDVRGYAMPQERSYDIDTPLDLAFAEFLLQHGG